VVTKKGKERKNVIKKLDRQGVTKRIIEKAGWLLSKNSLLDKVY